jgi:hypothetical protein
MSDADVFRIIIRMNGNEVTVRSVGELIVYLDSLGVPYEFFIKRRM